MKEWLRDVAIVFAILVAVSIGLSFLLRGDDEPPTSIPTEPFDKTLSTDTQQNETSYKDVLLKDYLISLPTEPITFEFESNSDGSCTLVDYSINVAPETVEHIDFPSASPDGEKVVKVDIMGANQNGNVPSVLTVEMYDRLLATFEQNEITVFETLKFKSHYGTPINIEKIEESISEIEDEAEREEAKKNLLKKYPYAEIMTLYVLADDTEANDLQALSRIFTLRGDYTQEDCINDYNNIIREAVEHENVTDDMLNGIPRPYIGMQGMPKSATVPEGVTCVESFNISTLQAVTLPDSLVEIGERAFYGTLLENVDLPDKLEKIKKSAFSSCYKLTSITIPSGVTEIDSYAFLDCESLEFVALPDNLTTIGHQAFYGCSSLTEIKLPKSITNIESSAFAKTGLTRIHYDGTVAEWEAFCSNPENQGWDDALDYIVYCTDGIFGQ